MEERIRTYFQAWLNKDVTPVRDIFSEDAVYVECYGPVYRGVEQIIRWFTDWNRRGTVLAWDIRRITVVERTAFVEWFFRCEYDGQPGAFDGVTVARFDGHMRNCELREFGSRAEHVHPYGEAPPQNG